MMKLSERIRTTDFAGECNVWPNSKTHVWLAHLSDEVAQLEEENARLVKVASHMDDCNTWSYVGEPCDCHLGLIAQLEAENAALKRENKELREFRDFVDILVKTLPRNLVDALLTAEKTDEPTDV